MLIATFVPTADLAGKTITQEGETFILEGHGPITAADVMAYDGQRQLVWVSDGTRAWVGSRAKATTPEPAAIEDTASPEPAMPDGSDSRPAGLAATPSRPALSRWLVVAAIAGAAIVGLVAVLAVSGAFGGEDEGASAGAPAGTWPRVFEGTWVENAPAPDPATLTITDGPGETAKIAAGLTGNRSFAFEFDGDQMSYVPYAGNPTLLTRTSGAAGYLEGDYTGNGSPMRMRVNHDGRALTLQMVLGEDLILNMSLTLSDDGKTLFLDDHSLNGGETFTRQ